LVSQARISFDKCYLINEEWSNVYFATSNDNKALNTFFNGPTGDPLLTIRPETKSVSIDPNASLTGRSVYKKEKLLEDVEKLVEQYK
jgi:hypothetical protein